jgi:hypothetical protein
LGGRKRLLLLAQIVLAFQLSQRVIDLCRRGFALKPMAHVVGCASVEPGGHELVKSAAQ